LFETLVKIGEAASSAEILEANNGERTVEEKVASPLCEPLPSQTENNQLLTNAIGLKLVGTAIFPARE
jgi:hypothetical protein